MSSFAIGAGVFLAIGVALAAAPAAAEWRGVVTGRSAWAEIERGPLMLSLQCQRGEDALKAVLFGGPFAGMKNANGAPDSMTMQIVSPGGRTEQFSVEGSFYGHDDAFVGRLEATGPALDHFAESEKLILYAPSGEPIFETGMIGAKRARKVLRAGCLI